ncbi:MAG: PepSY-like domain-containing protein [Bacteroidota bacterium]|nr:PepSY-like domain-containing protein [Bacteroidota bacterium]
MKHMKSFFFALLFCNTVFLACSQDIAPAQVPALVKNAQQIKFPDATQVEWEKKPYGYEAEFYLGSVEYKACISSEGKIIMYHQDISLSELPNEVSSAVKKAYADYTIDANDLEKIVKNDEVFYKVELEKGTQDLTQYYSSKGSVVPAPAI